MNKEETKEWMKEHYPDLTDFDNLQFVKDCEEEGVKKHKKKVEEVINELTTKVDINDTGEEEYEIIFVGSLKKRLGLE